MTRQSFPFGHCKSTEENAGESRLAWDHKRSQANDNSQKQQQASET